MASAHPPAAAHGRTGARAQNEVVFNREPSMTLSSAHSAPHALLDSALALLAACLAFAMFLPPLAAATAASPWREAAAGLVLVLALPLHWFSLTSAARQLGASRVGCLGLAVLLCPVGGAAALILLAGLAGVQLTACTWRRRST